MTQLIKQISTLLFSLSIYIHFYVSLLYKGISSLYFRTLLTFEDYLHPVFPTLPEKESVCRSSRRAVQFCRTRSRWSEGNGLINIIIFLSILKCNLEHVSIHIFKLLLTLLSQDICPFSQQAFFHISFILKIIINQFFCSYAIKIKILAKITEIKRKVLVGLTAPKLFL